MSARVVASVSLLGSLTSMFIALIYDCPFVLVISNDPLATSLIAARWTRFAFHVRLAAPAFARRSSKETCHQPVVLQRIRLQLTWTIKRYLNEP